MPYLGTIESLHNPHVRLVGRLQAKKRDRYRERMYVAEGYRLVQHVVSRGCRPALAFYTPESVSSGERRALMDALVSTDCRVWQVTDAVLAAVSDAVTPQGIVAAVPMPQPDVDAVRRADLLLVLDGWRTPGNLGTVLRTALATGVGAALSAPGTVDPYAPKVVRGAMGAHADLLILPDLAWPEIGALTAGKQCILAEAGAAATLWEVDWTQPSAMIVGGEAHGPSPEARALATGTARIPMVAGAESLNAAVAAAGFMFEAQRQRGLARR
jgi:RNA methyltransferase, TrmH family